MRNALWMDEHLPRGEVLDVRADGDAHLDVQDFASFVVPACGRCGGNFKPKVVFFGGSLEPETRRAASEMVQAADSILILGTSVQVFSAFRLVKAHSEIGKSTALVN